MSTAVLLHGFGTSARLWDAVLPLLDGPALTLDLPGFGDSHDRRYSVGGMADAVQDISPMNKIISQPPRFLIICKSEICKYGASNDSTPPIL